MSYNENDIKSALCIDSLQHFTQYFFKVKNKKPFDVSPHHKKIFDKLQEVIDGKIKRLIINMPPRYGKTEIAVKNFMAYGLAFNPASKFIHLSYSDSLALDNSEEVKDLITSDEYQDLFPYVKIKVDSRAKNKWYTTQNGGVYARSSSGQVTGFGAGSVDSEIFAGAIIIDDPIKPDDATSDTIRDKINNKFETTIRSRVNSRDTPIIVIMQRLNEEDLCGYLMGVEPDEWEVLCLPAIDEDGNALWENKHTLDELAKIKKANEYVFETQYLQNPKPLDGLVFPIESLNFYDEIDRSKADFRSAFIDIADTGEDNHSVPIGYNFGNKIYIDDVLFTKLGTDENVELTAEILNLHKPEWTRVESNMGGGMYIQLLKNHYKGQLLPIRAKSNKHTRILTLSGFIKEYCYFKRNYTMNSDYDKFIKNLTRYVKAGENKHDDAPDSLHGLTNMIRKFYPHLYNDFVIIGDNEN